MKLILCLLLLIVTGCGKSSEEIRAERKRTIAQKKIDEAWEKRRAEENSPERIAQREADRAFRQVQLSAVRDDLVTAELLSWERFGDDAIFVKVKISNGTDYVLSQLTVRVTAVNDSGRKVESGTVQLSGIEKKPLPPHSIEERNCRINLNVHSRHVWKVSIFASDVQLTQK